MLKIIPTQEWRNHHPGSTIGILEISNVDNTLPCPELDAKKGIVENELRKRYEGFSRSDFMATPILAEYEKYYKSFEKTYHVQLQLESIVLKGKSLPNVSPLVDANFAAEMQTLILTAGHDVSKLNSPVSIDISNKEDTITQMNGSTKPMRPGDMLMRDAGGVCCSIIYGQDNRSPISKETTHALYVAYAPVGISPESVSAQLQGILANILTFSPNCKVEQEVLIEA